MKRALGLLPLTLWAGLVAFLLGAAPGEANAAGIPPGAKLNACGCYQAPSGACFCGKKTKCVCPGECEPKGCEEKRVKELEKEIAAETKRAQEAERKQQEEKRRKEKEKEKAESGEGEEGGEEAAAEEPKKTDEKKAKDEDTGKKKKKPASKKGATNGAGTGEL
jgi:hypothetical protein